MKKKILARWQLYLLLLLPLLYIIIFAYVPMGGLIIAFKQYDFRKGILGSPWVRRPTMITVEKKCGI